jgi:hypothetical protein
MPGALLMQLIRDISGEHYAASEVPNVARRMIKPLRHCHALKA